MVHGESAIDALEPTSFVIVIAPKQIANVIALAQSYWLRITTMLNDPAENRQDLGRPAAEKRKQSESMVRHMDYGLFDVHEMSQYVLFQLRCSTKYDKLIDIDKDKTAGKLVSFIVRLSPVLATKC